LGDGIGDLSLQWLVVDRDFDDEVKGMNERGFWGAGYIRAVRVGWGVTCGSSWPVAVPFSRVRPAPEKKSFSAFRFLFFMAQFEPCEKG
jgi:hypothetical protein